MNYFRNLTVVPFFFIVLFFSGSLFPQSDSVKNKKQVITNIDSLVVLTKTVSTDNSGFNIKPLFPNPFCGVYVCEFSIGDSSLVSIQMVRTDTVGEVINYYKGILGSGVYRFDTVKNKDYILKIGVYDLIIEASTCTQPIRKINFRAVNKIFCIR